MDQRVPSPHRPPREEELGRAVSLALARRDVGAVVVLVDSDADCPIAWGPAATELVRARIPGSGVMAVREYEAWLLAGHRVFAEQDADAVHNPKAVAARLWPGYKPTTHQLELTRSLDIDLAIARSASLGKLARELARATED